jgi:hypothetical protein
MYGLLKVLSAYSTDNVSYVNNPMLKNVTQ